MLKSFKFKNFLSFKEEATFSLEKKESDKSHKESSFKLQKEELLKSAVVYGANASGKSNFTKAIVAFHNFVVRGFAVALDKIAIPVLPFLLSENSEKKPSFFEIEIMDKTKRYVYGFEVSREKVFKEWLYQYPQKTVLFERTGEKITSNRRFFKDATPALERETPSNVLFLSMLAHHKKKVANKIVDEIRKINVYPADQKEMLLENALNNFIYHKDEILEFLKEADFHINNLLIEQKEVNKEEFASFFPPPLREMATAGKERFFNRRVFTTHSKYDDKGNEVGEVVFDFMTQESEGTKRMLGLASLFVIALKEGNTLVIDELNSSLHPFLCSFVLRKFNSIKSNPNNSQLVFTTNDTSLLDSEFLRRDQIYFVEKDKYGSSIMFSLSDLGERKDLSYQKRYFEGRYGALPYIKSSENKWE